MPSKKLIMTIVVPLSVAVVAAGAFVLYETPTQATGSAGRSAEQAKRLSGAKPPIAGAQRGGRQAEPSSSSGEPSYFNPPVTGAGTGNPSLPIGNYFEYLRTSQPGYLAQPMYFLNITHSAVNGDFSGIMYMTYQDGKVDSAFPFNGTFDRSGTSITFTVSGPPTEVVYQGVVKYVQADVSTGQQLQATLSNRMVSMAGCNKYLHFLTAAGGVGASLTNLIRHPAICNFYYVGAEHFPDASQRASAP